MKINYKRTTYIFATAFILSLLMTIVVLAGSTNPSGPPTGTGSETSQMYTLEQIYQRLTNGTAATKNTTFTEPSSGPGSTMHTLDDIYDAIPYGGCDCDGGTLNGTRWCDNGDGTVTDLLGYNGKGECLVWLQNAGCVGSKVWANDAWWDGAETEAGILYDGTTHFNGGDCGLSDGSVEGDWRQPTKSELVAITALSGTEYIRSGTPRAFTNVQSYVYWSSTSYAYVTSNAWYVSLYYGVVSPYSKTDSYYVWPVRGGQ